MIDKKDSPVIENTDAAMLRYFASEEFDGDMKKTIELEYGTGHSGPRRSFCNDE